MNIEARTTQILCEAIDKYNSHPLCLTRYIGFPAVSFTLKGHCAGWAKRKEINLNLAIMMDKRYPQALHDTVIHELAHCIVMAIHDHRTKPHGIEWALVMHMLGQNAERCHSYDTQTARKTRKFEYQCQCTKKHVLGVRSHNKHQRGYANVYRCIHCKTTLKLIGEIK